MEFPLCYYGIDQISTLVITVGRFPGAWSCHCFSLVPRWRMGAVLKTPIWDITLCKYADNGGSRLLWNDDIAHLHCIIFHNSAIFIHQHNCENFKSHGCSLFWPWLSCFYCLVLWQLSTFMFHFDITGACVKVLNKRSWGTFI
jgi:hypothetical protein